MPATSQKALLPSMENEFVQKVREYAATEGNRVIPICAKLEEEVAQFNDCGSDRILEIIGTRRDRFEPSDQSRLRHSRPHLLFHHRRNRNPRLDHRQGTKAPEAAGKIHTDIQKGFIRAEVISYQRYGRLQWQSRGA